MSYITMDDDASDEGREETTERPVKALLDADGEDHASTMAVCARAIDKIATIHGFLRVLDCSDVVIIIFRRIGSLVRR